MPKPVLVLQDDKFIITKVPGLQREHEWACCSSFHTTFPSEKTVQSQSRRDLGEVAPKAVDETGVLINGLFH